MILNLPPGGLGDCSEHKDMGANTAEMGYFPFLLGSPGKRSCAFTAVACIRFGCRRAFIVWLMKMNGECLKDYWHPVPVGERL